jgi:hypothetical protein
MKLHKIIIRGNCLNVRSNPHNNYCAPLFHSNHPEKEIQSDAMKLINGYSFLFGNVKTNVEPLPSLLFAEIVPPFL